MLDWQVEEWIYRWGQRNDQQSGQDSNLQVSVLLSPTEAVCCALPLNTETQTQTLAMTWMERSVNSTLTSHCVCSAFPEALFRLLASSSKSLNFSVPFSHPGFLSRWVSFSVCLGVFASLFDLSSFFPLLALAPLPGHLPNSPVKT